MSLSLCISEACRRSCTCVLLRTRGLAVVKLPRVVVRLLFDVALCSLTRLVSGLLHLAPLLIVLAVEHEVKVREGIALPAYEAVVWNAHELDMVDELLQGLGCESLQEAEVPQDCVGQLVIIIHRD